MKLNQLLLLFFLSFIGQITLAQTSKSSVNRQPKGFASELAASAKPDSVGYISGKVIDSKTGSIISGAMVEMVGTSLKNSTDMDGSFSMKVKPGKYSIAVKLMAYQPKTETDVEVKQGEVSVVNMVLEPESKELKGTVVKGTAKKETMNALLIQQKNAPAVSDGISMETVKKSPDRSTADMLKRVSGATIQEGKFAIIRGLADRYNAAFINGAPLPSSESDRKAFSFDFFPSALIDNIVILKTATPDKTGDFAGGIIEINTRDIPDKKGMTLNLGSNWNSVSTGKLQYNYKGSNTDWLGIDNGSRGLPNGLPASNDFKKMSAVDQTAQSQQFANNWAIGSNANAAPAMNLQFTAANKFKLWGKDAGSLFALTYSNQQRFQKAIRQDYGFYGEENFKYEDSAYKTSVLVGAMFNTTIKLNSRNKISFKNTFNINSEDQTVIRRGYDVQAGSNVLSYAMLFSQNLMSSHQMIGEHVWLKSKVKVKWVGGLSTVNRNMPDYRRLRYFQPIDPDNPDLPYQAFVSASANPNEGGRFYSRLKENIWSLGGDVSKSIAHKKFKGEIKGGVYYQHRGRGFEARVVGYVINPGFQSGLLSLPVGQIFDQQNMRAGGFRMSENTNPNDQYTAQSNLGAAYLMADQRVAKWRIIYGARFELYNQQVNSNDYTNKPIVINNTKPDLLPSMNVCYALTGKSNLRAAASKTVARPEFRELAPFSFFDFNQFVSVAGFDKLQRTGIINLDLRYEIFPAAGELFSFGLFHKNFNNPIEVILEPAIGGGTRNVSYRNVPKASNMGLELEFRKKLPALFGKKWTKNLTASGNIALINSKVDMRDIVGASREYRPLQGQSPYVLNASLIYQGAKGFGAAMMVNRIGARISNVGTGVYLEFYEKPRTVVDMQLSKTLLKERMDIKMNLADLIAPGLKIGNKQLIAPQNQVFYQPMQPSKGEQINIKNSQPVNTLYYGRTVSLNVNWKF